MFSHKVSANNGRSKEWRIAITLSQLSEYVTNQLCGQFEGSELDGSKIQAIVNKAVIRANDSLVAKASSCALASLHSDEFKTRALIELMSEAIIGIYSTNAHAPIDDHKLSMSSFASRYNEGILSLENFKQANANNPKMLITTAAFQEAYALAIVKELKKRMTHLKGYLENLRVYNELMEKLNSKELTNYQKIVEFSKQYMTKRRDLQKNTVDQGNSSLKKLGHFVLSLLTGGLYAVAMASQSYCKRGALSFWKADSEVDMDRIERRIPKLQYYL